MRRLAWVFALFLCACAAPPRLDPRAAVFGPPRYDAPPPVEASLPGGAPVFLAEDRDLPLVRLFVSFRGGAVYDPPGQEGLSALAASAWRSGGTRARSAEAFDDLLEERAVELDLSLGRETGTATLSVLSGDLDRGLDLLAELLLAPAFDPERFDWAKEKALDALKREEEEPGALAFRELRASLYRGHPRGRHPTPATLSSLTRDDAVALHRRLVESSAWVLGASGDFDREELLCKLAARFGALRGASEAFAPLPPPPATEPELVIVPTTLPQATLVWAALAPDAESPLRAGQEAADFILGGGGFQSRLMREVREARGLAYGVDSFYSAYPGFGVAGVSASTATAQAPQVFTLLSGELEKAASTPFGDDEVARARRTLANRQIFRFRDPADAVRERMGLALLGLPADLTERVRAALDAVTPAQAAAAAAATYPPGRGVWVLVGDLSPDDPAWAGSRRVRVAPRGHEGEGSKNPSPRP